MPGRLVDAVQHRSYLLLLRLGDRVEVESLLLEVALDLVDLWRLERRVEVLGLAQLRVPKLRQCSAKCLWVECRRSGCPAFDRLVVVRAVAGNRHFREVCVGGENAPVLPEGLFGVRVAETEHASVETILVVLPSSPSQLLPEPLQFRYVPSLAPVRPLKIYLAAIVNHK